MTDLRGYPSDVSYECYDCNNCVMEKKWEELKTQVEHEIFEAELGLVVATDTVNFPERSPSFMRDDEMYHQGMVYMLKKIQSIMTKLEEEGK